MIDDSGVRRKRLCRQILRGFLRTKRWRSTFGGKINNNTLPVEAPAKVYNVRSSGLRVFYVKRMNKIRSMTNRYYYNGTRVFRCFT